MCKRFMRIYFIAIMWFVSAGLLMAQSVATAIIVAGDASDLYYILGIKDIEHLSNHDLRLLRNTIFAKYDYSFFSEDLRSHFSSFPWYTGNKTDVQNELTLTDWTNIAIIQSIESSNREGVKYIGSFGEHFTLSGRLLPFTHISGIPTERVISGEIVAVINRIEIARTNIIIDNEFHLQLDEVSPDVLEDWEKGFFRLFNTDTAQCSDPETRIAFLSLGITETEFSIHSDLIPWQDDKPRLYSFRESRLGMRSDDQDEFFYIYSDRDAFIRGINLQDQREDKTLYNISLKNGWNKIINYRTTNNDFNIYESTFESGIYKLYHFDLDDYISQPYRQLITLTGEISTITPNRLLLNKPLRHRINGESVHVNVVGLFFHKDIHKTFPTPGDYYTFYGDILRWGLTSEGDPMLWVIEFEKSKKRNYNSFFFIILPLIGLIIIILYAARKRVWKRTAFNKR